MDDDITLKMLDSAMIDLHMEFARLPGSTLHLSDDCLWYESSIGFPFYGGVVQAKFAEHAADTRIADVIGAMRATGKVYFWTVLPTSAPANLGERLRASGLNQFVELAGMALDFDDLAPAPMLPQGVEIVRAEDEAHVTEYARLYPKLFGEPTDDWLDQAVDAELAIWRSGGRKIHRYLAIEHGEAVCAGMVLQIVYCLVLETLYTKPEARGRGLGQALSTRALTDNRGGFQHAVVWAGPHADVLYRRMGYIDVAKATVFS